MKRIHENLLKIIWWWGWDKNLRNIDRAWCEPENFPWVKKLLRICFWRVLIQEISWSANRGTWPWNCRNKWLTDTTILCIPASLPSQYIFFVLILALDINPSRKSLHYVHLVDLRSNERRIAKKNTKKKHTVQTNKKNKVR